MCGIGVPNGAPLQLRVGALATHVKTTTDDPGFPDAQVAALAREGSVLPPVLTAPSGVSSQYIADGVIRTASVARRHTEPQHSRVGRQSNAWIDNLLPRWRTSLAVPDSRPARSTERP
jgi:hypothetical protein